MIDLLNQEYATVVISDIFILSKSNTNLIDFFGKVLSCLILVNLSSLTAP